MSRRLLTARWVDLAMVNYEVDPELLRALIPAGTELDLWFGQCLVSVVGFQFLDTRVLGLALPFHRDFEEVNLRFYVRRTVGDEVRRGVVFVKEIVPRRAIALIANAVYNEKYIALPMSRRHDGDRRRLSYDGVLKAPCADCRDARRRFLSARGRFGGSLHLGTLLGLHHAARWIDAGIQGRASALERLDGERS